MTDAHADPDADAPNGDSGGNAARTDDVAPDADATPTVDEALARVAAETDVPPDSPTHVCERCGRPFARESYVALHRGLAHYDDLTDAERESFETSYRAERDDIRRFRIAALGGLVVLYFGFLLAYAMFA
jgi:hypothetical protein